MRMPLGTRYGSGCRMRRATRTSRTPFSRRLTRHLTTHTERRACQVAIGVLVPAQSLGAREENIRVRAQLNLEYDFAELRTGFEVGVGGGSFGERKDAIDDGFEAA